MKKLCLVLAAIAVLLFSCKKEPEKWKEKLIVYKDSLQSVPLDSIFLFGKDSNYVKADGYYKIYGLYPDTYNVGQIKNNNKVGLWKSFMNNALEGEERYNSNGELNGKAVKYDSYNGDLFSVYNYVNGEQEGTQKEYHTKNVLARLYTLDKSYNYRGDYVCYDVNGKVLYQTNFGNEGTGYYKEFHNDTLFREGAILKDKFVGMHIRKEFFHGRKPLIEQTFYNDSGRFFKVKLFGNLKDAIETKGDSIVYDYANNKTTITTFLKGKVITNEVLNDTVLF